MRRATIAGLLCVVLPALAQHHGYAPLKEREIKALSPEAVTQYQSGAGMGYAIPAELNRFPGPMHVLELADKLDLTPEQVARTRELMDAHKAEARAVGAKRVESERVLEALFRSGKVDEAALATAVREAAALEGAYRLAHLDTHRRMRELLSERQVEQYVRLRGYAGSGTHGRH